MPKPSYLLCSDVVQNLSPKGRSGLGDGAVGKIVHLQEPRAVDRGRAEVERSRSLGACLPVVLSSLLKCQ